MQERHIEAASLAEAERQAKYLISLVPGASLISVLRDDVKHEPYKACPGCVAEAHELRAKRTRKGKPVVVTPPEHDHP